LIHYIDFFIHSVEIHQAMGIWLLPVQAIHPKQINIAYEFINQPQEKIRMTR